MTERTPTAEPTAATSAFLEERGFKEILPAGYSFGAWVSAGVLGRRALAPAIFVAPPIDLFPFDPETLRNLVGLIVYGDRDPYCPADEIRLMAETLLCRLVFVPGTDHFFLSRERDLAACIDAFARKGGK